MGEHQDGDGAQGQEEEEVGELIGRGHLARGEGGATLWRLPSSLSGLQTTRAALRVVLCCVYARWGLIG